MEMKQYMDKDLSRLDNMVHDLSENVSHWDTDKVFEKAREMFDAFSQRFNLEDYLLCNITPNNELCPAIQKFLKRRGELRQVLENILKLHADEPDFHKEISHVLEIVHKHLKYRESEFYPLVIDRLPPADLERMHKALGTRLQHTGSI